MSIEETKRQVAEIARKMAQLGLVSGTNGNVSARLTDGLFAITPMGGRCEGMSVDQVVIVNSDLSTVYGELVPSSESLLHMAIYEARPDVGGIVHTHPTYASTLAVVGVGIPPILDEMVLTLGGEVKVSEYAPPASEEVAARACEALGSRDAALMRNHGAVAVGATPQAALDASILTERVAAVFVLSSILGHSATLPDDVVASEAAIFEMRRVMRLE